MQSDTDPNQSNEQKEGTTELTIAAEKTSIDRASRHTDALVKAWLDRRCQILDEKYGYTSPKQPNAERDPQWQIGISLVRSIAEYLQTTANTAIFSKIKLLLSVAQTNLRSRYSPNEPNSLFSQEDDRKLGDYIHILDQMLQIHTRMDILGSFAAPSHIPTCDEVLQGIGQRFSDSEDFALYMRMYQQLVISQPFLVEITNRFPSVFTAPMVKFITNEQASAALHKQNFSTNVIFIVFTGQTIKVDFYATQDYNAAGLDRNNATRDQSQGDWYFDISRPESIGAWVSHQLGFSNNSWNTNDLEVSIASSQQLNAFHRTLASRNLSAQPNQTWNLFAKRRAQRTATIDSGTLIPDVIVAEVDTNPIMQLGALCGRPVKELLAVQTIDKFLAKRLQGSGTASQTPCFSELYFYNLFKPHASSAQTIIEVQELVKQFVPSPEHGTRMLCALLQLNMHTPIENNDIPDRALYFERLLIATYPRYFAEHRLTKQLIIADHAEHQSLLHKAFSVHESFGFADVTRLDAGALDRLYETDNNPLWKMLKTTIAVGSPVWVDNQLEQGLESNPDTADVSSLSPATTQVAVFKPYDKITAYAEMIALLKALNDGDPRAQAINALIESAYAIKGAYALADDAQFEQLSEDYTGDRKDLFSVEVRCLREHHHRAIDESEQNKRASLAALNQTSRVVMRLMATSSKSARSILQTRVNELAAESLALRGDIASITQKMNNIYKDFTSQAQSRAVKLSSTLVELQESKSENHRIRDESNQVKTQLEQTREQNEHILAQSRSNALQQRMAYFRMQATLKIMKIISAVLFTIGILMVLALTLGPSYLPIVAALSAEQIAFGTTIGCSSAAAGGTGFVLSHLFKPPAVSQQPVTSPDPVATRRYTRN